jgi:hypothetical protein
MSEIRNITAMEPGWYGVELREGDLTTAHRVQVPDDPGEVGLPEAEPEVLVREAMAFLLDREPASAILSEFSLADIPKYFADFADEMATRVGAS